MAQSPLKAQALRDPKLLQDVVAFKDKFYPCGWARYDLARPGTIRLVPPEHVLTSVKRDYAQMRIMIFGEIPSLDEIVRSISLNSSQLGRREAHRLSRNCSPGH